MLNHKRGALIIARVVLTLAGAFTLAVTHEYRHQQLNSQLIVAIKARNDNETLRSIAQGATGDAREGDWLVTYRDVIGVVTWEIEQRETDGTNVVSVPIEPHRMLAQLMINR